jgi:hypothetical protein
MEKPKPRFGFRIRRGRICWSEPRLRGGRNRRRPRKVGTFTSRVFFQRPLEGSRFGTRLMTSRYLV